MLKILTQKKTFPLLALAMAAIYGFNHVGLTAINPFNTGWQFNQHDSSTHYIGWEFFRQEPWSFPLGVIHSYIYPQGTSIVFTDSIPLVALILKLFNSLLPTDFQYFGIWRLVNYALQGLFGYLLVYRTTKCELSGLAGSVLFTIAPIFSSRIDHAALQSHWLILCALYLYLKNDSIKTRLLWLLLLPVSVLIHFYLFAMTIALWFAHLTREVLNMPSSKRFRLFISVAGTLSIIILTMWATGYFVSGLSVSPPPHSPGSFGQRSMNINAPFNPGYGYSGLHLPKLPIISKDQWNGFCYLGVGTFMLFLLSVYAIWGSTYDFLKKHLPLSAMCLLFICFAISNIVTLGERVLLEIPLPDWLQIKFNLFRASGRFIWPVNYALLAGCCAALARKYSREATFILLCVIVGIQITDLWPQHWRRSQLFETTPDYCASPFKSPRWQEFAKRYQHIAFIPPNFDWRDNQCDDYVHFAKLAITNGMTLNTGYLARYDNRTEYSNELAREFTNGTLPSDTLYILKGSSPKKLYATDKYTVTQGELDGFTIIAPDTPTKTLNSN